MTITPAGNGAYTIQFNATEQAQLARATRRRGSGALKDLIESWLARAGGADEKFAELKDAYAGAAANVQAQVDALLGVS